jgi:alpha-L-fucosidase
MKAIFITLVVFFGFFVISFPVSSQSASPDTNERMDWWREAKFGMFIHWGVYSVFENKYDGVDVNGNQVHYDMKDSAFPAEWIMYATLIPRNVYWEAAQQFDAKDYDPKLWVQIAKEAGMKYIIITSKHHDGFCLFDSQYTGWDAVDASAAGRDLLQDLVSEAKAAGLKIGFYYSQNLDWMHEGGMGEIPELNKNYYSTEQVRNYVNHLVIPHIRELADKYDFDVMWFDAPAVANVDKELNNTILQALKDSPVGHKIIINDRLCVDCESDFITPESDTPDIPYNGFPNNQDWEACASLNSSWGYEGDSESYYWKSPMFTIGRVLELASKGGNFLLNVGPDKHGVIPAPAVRTLKEVGQWMGKNGASVYGTEKNQLLNPFEYGYVTQKTTPDGRFHWYLHVSLGYWNEEKVYLYGITERPIHATYVANGMQADVEWDNNILTVHLPEVAPDTYYATIDLCFDHLPEQVPLSQMRNNQLRLTPYQAVTSHGMRKDFQPYALKEWFGRSNEVRYNLYLEKGVYGLQSEYAAIETGELYFHINNSIYTAHYSKTDNYKEGNKDMEPYITDRFPNLEIQIPQSGIYPLVITRNAEIPGHFNIINVRSFTLNRVDIKPGHIDVEPGNTTQTHFCYPNPARNGYFYCTLSPGQSLRMYDTVGRLQKSCIVGENRIIDVSDLASGVYMVMGTGMNGKIIILNPD